jgi:hypothetical protein
MKKLTELLNEEQNIQAVVEHFEDIKNDFLKRARQLSALDAEKLHDLLKSYFNSLY